MPVATRYASARPTLYERPSKADQRQGMCTPDLAQNYVKQLETANRLAQWQLFYPQTRPGKSDLPYYDTIKFDDVGNFVEPPQQVALSDALVFLVVASGSTVRDRRVKWPNDFNTEGDVYAERWPRGEPVVLWAFGIPFLPVYSDYYLLCGSHLRPYLWQLTHKPKGKSLPYRGCRFGQVVGPIKRLSALQGNDTTLIIDHDSPEKTKFSVDLRYSPTDLVMTYGDNSVVLTTLTNLTAFHPKSGLKGNQVMDKPSGVTEEAWDTAKAAPYSRGTRTQYHDKKTWTAHIYLANRPEDEKRVERQSDNPTQGAAGQPNATTSNTHTPAPSTDVDAASAANPNEQQTIDLTREPPWKSPTTAVRDMFRGFDDDITTECDDIDKISQSAWLWRRFDGELQGPDKRQVIRMYIDATDARREYETRMALAETRIRARGDDAVKHVLRRLLDGVRLPADETRGTMLPPQPKFDTSAINVIYEYKPEQSEEPDVPTAPSNAAHSNLSESTEASDHFTLAPATHSPAVPADD